MSNDQSYHLEDPLQKILDKLNVINIRLETVMDLGEIKEYFLTQVREMKVEFAHIHTVSDKLDHISNELEVLRMMMHIKEKTAACAFCADEAPKRSRNELIGDLDYMIVTLQSISSQAKQAPVTHADHLSLMMLISSLFKAS